MQSKKVQLILKYKCSGKRMFLLEKDFLAYLREGGLATVPEKSAQYGPERVTIVERNHKRQNRHRGFRIFATIGVTA